MLSLTLMAISATRSKSFEFTSSMARVTSINHFLSALFIVIEIGSDKSQWIYFFRDYLVIPKANIKSFLFRSLVRSRSTAPLPSSPSQSLTTSVKTGSLTHTHLSLDIVKNSFRGKATNGSRNRLMALHQDHYRCSKSVASNQNIQFMLNLFFSHWYLLFFLQYKSVANKLKRSNLRRVKIFGPERRKKKKKICFRKMNAPCPDHTYEATKWFLTFIRIYW